MKALVVLFLLIVPATAADWGQHGGDMYKSRVAALPEAPLDVLSWYRLFPEEMATGTANVGFIDTPYGATGLVQDVGVSDAGSETDLQCRLLRLLDPMAGQVEELSQFPCENGGKMLAYDETRDLLFIAVEEALPDRMLRFLDASDGRELWATGPGGTLPPTPAVQDRGDWFIDDAVLDEEQGILYVPFAAESGIHSIEAIDIDARRSLWQTVVPIERTVSDLQISPGPPDELSGLPGQATRPYPAINSLTLTRTDTGLVAILYTSPYTARVAWMDLAGSLVGTLGHEPRDYPDPEREDLSHSLWATGDGSQAALLFGNTLVYINPASPDVEEVDIDQYLATVTFPSPAWLGDRVVFPVNSGAYIHEPNGGKVQYWPGYQGGRIGGVIGTPAGDAWAGMVHAGSAGPSNALVAIDLDDARTVQSLPLPDVGTFMRLLPLTSPPGLLVWDAASGLATFLGEAQPDRVPAVTVSSRYPAIDEPTTMSTKGSAAEGLLVAWGDGTIEQLQPGETATRAFAEAGLHILRVTAVHPDNRTATTEVPIFVGQDPPRDLNALQTAFAPENQDMTFGVLGVALALGGGLVAVGRRRTRRGRLQRELEAIDALVAGAQGDVGRLEALVSERRAHVRGLVVDGTLDEGQASILERRLDEVQGSARMGEIENLLDQLPHRFVRHVNEALADGRVSAFERDSLLSLVEQDEIMTPDVKGRARNLIDRWFKRDSGVDA